MEKEKGKEEKVRTKKNEGNDVLLLGNSSPCKGPPVVNGKEKADDTRPDGVDNVPTDGSVFTVTNALGRTTIDLEEEDATRRVVDDVVDTVQAKGTGSRREGNSRANRGPKSTSQLVELVVKVGGMGDEVGSAAVGDERCVATRPSTKAWVDVQFTRAAKDEEEEAIVGLGPWFIVKVRTGGNLLLSEHGGAVGGAAVARCLGVCEDVDGVGIVSVEATRFQEPPASQPLLLGRCAAKLHKGGNDLTRSTWCRRG